MRSEKRIRAQMEMVTLLVWKGFTIAQIARVQGAPSERTLRRWTAENLLGFGKEYHEVMVVRSIKRLRAGIEADLSIIRARAERRSRTKDRTT